MLPVVSSVVSPLVLCRAIRADWPPLLSAPPATGGTSMLTKALHYGRSTKPLAFLVPEDAIAAVLGVLNCWGGY